MTGDLGPLIDGEWVSGGGRRRQPVIDPASGDTVAMLTLAARPDIDRAIASSARAFRQWRSVTALERARILGAVAASVRSQSAALGAILSREQGKPAAEAAGEVAGTADTFEWLAEEGKRVYGRVVPSRYPDTEQFVLREPIGPVAAFSPWNAPLVLAARKIATALAAGCSIVIKPPEETPGCVVALARICTEAGLPAGVLNVLFGDPAEISTCLIAAPEIKLVSFTGSVAVGRHLAGLAGSAMKKIVLELGGHSPVFVLSDTDVERVVSLSVTSKFRNAGQICHAPARFFVHVDIFDRFVGAFAERAQALRVGAPQDPASQMGPLLNARRIEAMASLTDDAVARGATLVCGGRRTNNGGGFFWPPTVLSRVTPDAAVMREEPFGPIAPMIAFDDLDTAIAQANAVEYGLAGYVFTDSARAARRIYERLETGSVSINTFAISPPEMPFGGVKSSGIGSEMGIEGIGDHLIPKAVIRTDLPFAAAAGAAS